MKKWLAHATTFAILALLIPSILVKATPDLGNVLSISSTNAALITQSSTTNSTGLTMLVIANSTIYEGVKQSLEQYRADLENFGFEHVIILIWSDNDPLLIRTTLQQFYSNSSLAGVLLVGDLPAAEYEMFTEWDYERFPMDLYYMDLDGNWTDTDGDGVLDGHVGKKVAPDIWVGRVKASNLGEDEVQLINSYFDKNHRYRVGTLTSARRALLYIDDDWSDYESMDSDSLGVLYRDTTVVADKAATTAADYRSRLGESYEWVHLRSHGTWDRHSFEVPSGDGGIVESTEYAQIDPNVLFYQFFVCQAGRFTQPNYLAGEAVFRTSKGLLAISSTKLGGMLMFWTFYEALARGRTIGDAFKEWFIQWGEGKAGISDAYLGRKWFYGMTIIGDPALRLVWLGEKEIAELEQYEEEAVAYLPLVQDLLRQVSNYEINYSSLSDEYNNLKNSYSSQQTTLQVLANRLTDIRNVLYIFLLVTVALIASNVYLVKSKPKSKAF